jgi:hypothetical protein
MKKLKLFSCFLLLHSAFSGSAQARKDSLNPATSVSNNPIIGNLETRQIFKRKGQFSFSWGYNRAFFSKSDIHLTGDGYDFTITNVTARDQPGGHDFTTYIKPNTFTIPQFNWRVGYYLTDKTFITFGHDHMKYNMDKQVTLLTGKISTGVNDGSYNNTEVLVGENGESGVYMPSSVNSLPTGFVSEFEHCDGLNDFTFELGHLEQLWISNNCKHAFSALGTVGTGMLIPDSDTDILGQAPKHDMTAGKKAYHLAGYSFSSSLGLQFDFCRHFFIQGKLKGGYINLPDINTTVGGGKASQSFSFIEPILLVGYTHAFGKK